MRSVGWAFAWEAWGRYRLVLTGALVYLIAVLVLIPIAPEVFAASLGLEGHQPLRFLLSIPLCILLVFVACAFAQADQADIVASASGYPRRHFTLPLSTRALVAWPAFLGGLTVALLWLLLAGLIWRPAGLHAPLLWPALLSAAFLTWLQALVWSPFPLPFLRILVLVFVVNPVFLAIGFGGHFFQVPEGILVVVSGGLIGAGHAVAVAGVARARRGDGNTGSATHGAAFLVTQVHQGPADLPPFQSPARALCWLAWRRGGYTLPLMVGLICLPHLGLLVFAGPDKSVLVFFIVTFFFPVLMAIGAGGSLASAVYTTYSNHQLPPFIVAKPVPTATLVGSLLRVAVPSVLFTYLLVVLGVVVVLPFSHAGPQLIQGFGKVVETHGSKAWVLLALTVIGLPLVTWKELISAFWFVLIGRRWVSYLVLSAIVVGYIGLALFASWANRTPASHAALVAAVPWLLAAALTLKVLGGAIVARELHCRDLLAGRTIVRVALIWVAAAGLIVGLAFWLTPVDNLGTGAPIAPWGTAAAAILLLLPLVRLGLAPLALDCNRHR
jgi:hypothetical protein